MNYILKNKLNSKSPYFIPTSYMVLHFITFVCYFFLFNKIEFGNMIEPALIGSLFLLPNISFPNFPAFFLFFIGFKKEKRKIVSLYLLVYVFELFLFSSPTLVNELYVFKNKYYFFMSTTFFTTPHQS